MTSLPPIERFTANTGAVIYRIPVEAFPGFIAYCYVLLNAGIPTLIDTGSGIGSSTAQLIKGIEALRDDFSESVALADLKRIIITHGHIDHFGGLAHLHERTGAQVAVHQLDRRVLTNYEERVIVATKDLRVYLERAGVKAHLRENLMLMYGFAKKEFRSVPVDVALDDGMVLDTMTFLHTPGHCPGQVCIIIGDVLISADHILAQTTPHQSPESITHYTGLGHYLDSLKVVSRVGGLRLALGGHEAPIHDVYGRIGAIRDSHMRKLDRVIETIRTAAKPCSISDISKAMYPERGGYDVLLALEEVGAHVEYLYEHGMLEVSNLAEVEARDNPALLYGLA
ncbi:MAG: MBL fold metallo-hydrolase [bacterium]|nr:MBL fold metallo-hydrolase [bacterium]